MDWPRMFLAGLKAAAMGSLIGTSLLTLVMLVVVAIGAAEGEVEIAFVLFLPFLIGFVCALVGLAVLGLPLTVWLRRKGQESRRAYLSGGLICGAVTAFAVSWVLIGAVGGFAALFFAAFGAFTGGATGHFWWRYARQADVEHNLEPLVEVFE